VRIVALVVAAALAAGCSHAVVVVNGGAAVSTGTAVTSGTAGLTVASSSFVPVFAAAMIIAAGMDYSRDPQPFPGPSALFAQSRPAPEMAASRLISEQDCSKPVDLSLGNLRCK